MELNHHQTQVLLSRFPKFELSYETISHKKVEDTDYNLAMAISTGKKSYLWLTFHKSRNSAYLLEIGKDKRINRIQLLVSTKFPKEFAKGVVLYGTYFVENNKRVFLAEDIHIYMGRSLRDHCFSEKLGYLVNVMSKIKSPEFPIALSYMWMYSPNGNCDVPDLGYTLHHVQYRNCSKLTPYINYSPTSPGNAAANDEETYAQNIGTPPSFVETPVKQNYSLPQFKMNTVFKVKPDVQYDIYHLFTREDLYVGYCAIPTYKKSIEMNAIFRKIRENKNLDYIEESDDENDFEDIRYDKWVDINKCVNFECKYSTIFKKWIPIKQSNKSPPISIRKLTTSSSQ